MARTSQEQPMAVAICGTDWYPVGAKYPHDHELVRLRPLHFARSEAFEDLEAARLRLQNDLDAAADNRRRMWAEAEARDAERAAAEKAAADQRVAANRERIFDEWMPGARS